MIGYLLDLIAVSCLSKCSPSKFMNVTTYDHRTFDNQIFGCGKVYYSNSIIITNFVCLEEVEIYWFLCNHFACSGLSHTVSLTAWLSGTRPDIGRTRPRVVSRTADLQQKDWQLQVSHKSLFRSFFGLCQVLLR
jgi:hypothetical protein